MNIHFPVLLDGGTGTELVKFGYDGTSCAEKWILEHPEAMIAIQKAYIEAGSRIIYAPTFGANRVKLEKNGIFGQTEAYNIRLVNISRKAAEGTDTLVAGDLAPSDLFTAPVGEHSFEELVDVYTEQARALEKAGVDLYVAETLMTLSDARAALLAIRSVSEKPVFLSFTCDANGRTLTGSDVAAALTILQSMGADGFGLNCSVGPDQMVTQIRRLYPYSEIPLFAKPNAGIPAVVDGKAVYNCPPEEFASYVNDFLQAGASCFGGCCGTTPEHIRVSGELLKTFPVKVPTPKYQALLQAATEKKVFLLPPDVTPGTVLLCDEDLEENCEDVLDSEEPLLTIRLQEASDVEIIEESQYLFDKPVCFLCEDAQLLEKVLRVYQGRALYSGSLPEDIIHSLAKTYGCIRLR